MRQLFRTSSGRARPAFTSMVIALVAVLGCSETSTQPDPVVAATYAFSGTVDGFPGLALADARVTILDASGTILTTSVAALTPVAAAVQGSALVEGPASFSVTVEVEAEGTLTYRCEILDSEEEVMYEAPEGTLQGGTDEAVALTSFAYTGPGVDAATAQVDLGGTQSLRVGEAITAVARLQDAGGTPVKGVPVHWTVDGDGLELVRTYSVDGEGFADVLAIAPTTTAGLSFDIPTGLTGAGALEIVEPVMGDAILDLTIPLFPGLRPTEARILLHGDVARDTVVALIPPQVVAPSEMELHLEIPVDITLVDQYVADVTVLRSGEVIYGADQVTVIGGGAAVPVALAYHGPGADATGIEMSLGEAEITIGQSTTATATVTDAGGSTISGVPIAWTLENPGLAADVDQLRLGLESITIEGGVEAGTFEVRATTPTGLEATATLTLVLPAGSGPVTIDFDTYPDGSPTVTGPVGTEYSDLGVILSFMPYSFSQGETTRMPHLLKSGSDGVLENGKRLSGSMATGFFRFDYPNTVNTVELVVWPGVSGWTGSDRIFVLDGDGVVVTSSATITSYGSTHTVEYAGGIGRVVVETGNGRMLITQISHE